MEDSNNLFDFDFDLTFSDDVNFDSSFITPTSAPNDGNKQSPISIEDIEQLLFKDDDDQAPNEDAERGFLHHILLDSPLEEAKSGEVIDHSDSTAVREKESSDHDPIAKKRQRQLRNRDAAVRSRERKKMHVKDLEMKSRYYEGECRRLGSLLQWYMAENQALRFSLTKQESAVLLLESLLLGSLLWLMVVLPSLVLQLLLTPHYQSQMVSVVEEKHVPSLALRMGGGKTLLVGKRFKASRARMRHFLQVVSGFLICLPSPIWSF